jgi:enterobactin synthetase component D / holo-[acyl-carrier protein] synthase
MTLLLSPPAKLRDMFPAAVAVGTMPNSADWRELPAAEQALVSHAVEKRQREFATGRTLARRLFGKMGLETRAIGQRQNRSPIWPTGVLGSISHCDDLCVVAVARDNVGIRSLGVDVEPTGPLPSEIWEEVARDDEYKMLSSGKDDLAIGMLRLFSAKEAAYKCLYPVTQQTVEFHELRILFSMNYASFQVRCMTPILKLAAERNTIRGKQIEIGGRFCTAAIWYQ